MKTKRKTKFTCFHSDTRWLDIQATSRIKIRSNSVWHSQPTSPRRRQWWWFNGPSSYVARLQTQRGTVHNVAKRPCVIEKFYIPWTIVEWSAVQKWNTVTLIILHFLARFNKHVFFILKLLIVIRTFLLKFTYENSIAHKRFGKRKY